MESGVLQEKSWAERMQLLHELAVQQMRTLKTLEVPQQPSIEEKCCPE